MPNLHAFWNYSRQLEDLGAAELHQCMQGALGDKLALLAELRIFRDNDARLGIPSGKPWPEGIVDALAASALFFWLQSPRWWREPAYCRLEWQAFQDRVSSVGAELWPGAADQPRRSTALWQAAVVPIRLSELTGEDRSTLGHTALQPMLSAWDGMQVLDVKRQEVVS